MTCFRFAILVVLFSMLACGARMKRTSLMDDVNAYNDGVRWHQYPKAAARIHPTKRTEFVTALNAVEDELKISDWELIHIEYEGKKRTVAKVLVKYTWFLDSVGTVHDTATLQTWRRFGKRWLVVKERRIRGEAMPGIEEPLDEEEGEKTPFEGEERDEKAGKPMKSKKNPVLSLRHTVFEFR